MDAYVEEFKFPALAARFEPIQVPLIMYILYIYIGYIYIYYIILLHVLLVEGLLVCMGLSWPCQTRNYRRSSFF